MYGWALNHAVDLLPQAARQQALTCNCLNRCKLCCLYTLSAAPVPRFNMCARADGWPAPSLQQHMQVILCDACTPDTATCSLPLNACQC